VILTFLFPDARAANCFTFDEPIKKPARDPIEFEWKAPFPAPIPEDVSESGKLPHVPGGFFCATRAIIHLSINQIYEKISNPRFLKDNPVMEVQFTEEKKPGFIRFLKLNITVRPFPFVTARWNEIWAFNITKGSEKEPEEILLTYQKTDGVEQLRHLCGSIWMRKLSDQYTDVARYEEVSSSYRNPQEVISGQLESFAALRKFIKKIDSEQ
jgi:hypothetical protein